MDAHHLARSILRLRALADDAGNERLAILCETALGGRLTPGHDPDTSESVRAALREVRAILEPVPDPTVTRGMQIGDLVSFKIAGPCSPLWDVPAGNTPECDAWIFTSDAGGRVSSAGGSVSLWAWPGLFTFQSGPFITPTERFWQLAGGRP